MANPFDKFKLKNKKIKIKALDNAEVTIQELTVAQASDFSKRIVKGFDKDGKAELDYNELTDIKVEKVSACMIEPVMTVKELNLLATTASAALDEISEAIDKFESELKK